MSISKLILLTAVTGAFVISSTVDAAQPRMVLNLVGIGGMFESTVPDIDGDGVDDPAICFTVGLLNGEGRSIGVATDCLSNITPVGTGLAVVGTSIFNLNGGTLVTRGNSTIQPVLQPTVGSIPEGVVTFTNITGANGTGNAILSGTRRFEGAEGTVRLSGMVDMAGFTGAVGDPVAFDCLFVVDFN